jgi:hypothetical protein
MKKKDPEFSHDCEIDVRVKVDPPYAFMELELEDGIASNTGDSVATLTEEGMEKLIEYLRQKLDEFRVEVNKHVDKGMRFSPRSLPLHAFAVDFKDPKKGAKCWIDEKEIRLSSFTIDWEAGNLPLVKVSFFSGKVEGVFPEAETATPKDWKATIFNEDGTKEKVDGDTGL